MYAGATSHGLSAVIMCRMEQLTMITGKIIECYFVFVYLTVSIQEAVNGCSDNSLEGAMMLN